MVPWKPCFEPNRRHNPCEQMTEPMARLIDHWCHVPIHVFMACGQFPKGTIRGSKVENCHSHKGEVLANSHLGLTRVNIGRYAHVGCCESCQLFDMVLFADF